MMVGKRSTSLSAVLLVLTCTCGPFTPAGFARNQNDGKEVIRQARFAYYSLRRLGLSEFRSSLIPNWEVVLDQTIKSDPVRRQDALKALNSLHFHMLLDSAGVVTVAHQQDAPAANEKVAVGFDQIFKGMEEAVTGFFSTWSLFMLNPPFPESESPFQLEQAGAQYRLSYKEGDADVVTLMTKEFIITDLRVSSNSFTSSIRPQLTRYKNGFVLTGYDADYDPKTGPGRVKLKVQIGYQEISGMQLPHSLNVDAVYDGTQNQVELVFANCPVKPRAAGP